MSPNNSVAVISPFVVRKICGVPSGGEPPVRAHLPVLVQKLAGLRVPSSSSSEFAGRKPDLALTTNGVLLKDHAKELYDAGLHRINVHLDTLDRERFKHITRRDDLPKVIEGIDVAQKLGFGPIKINAVAVKGLVEPDIVPMARFGRERGIEIRYIEFMPLDSQGIWDQDRVLRMDIPADVAGVLRTAIEAGNQTSFPNALEYARNALNTVLSRC